MVRDKRLLCVTRYAKMVSMTRKTLLAALMIALLPAASPAAAATPAAGADGDVRLYTLDCGHLSLSDMGIFSDTGEHAGEKGEMAVPCYLIRDGGRWLLWDTGLGDRLAATPDGETILGGQWTVRRTLVSQLAELGLKPDDIDFVGLSHLHADHSGNVGLFPKAIFLLGQPELGWAEQGGIGTDPKLVATVARDHVEPVVFDKDVFGDGRVTILKTPGHTPGHQSLLVKLPHAGAYLLTGDLYHTRQNYVEGLVPGVNVSRADTLASFDKFRRIVDRTGARVIVQHSPEDFAAMPAFPAYLN
jgi:N-acyl homoserine lactone hydrolase